MKKGSYLIIFLILFFSISNVKAVDQKLQCSYIKEETEKLEQKYEELLKEHEELLKQLGTTTAEEGDILEGKKAYSKGQLLTGTLPNNGNLTSTIKSGDSYTLKNGFYEESKIKVLTLAEQTKANATNNKILLGYTAWVNGEKVIGTNKGYEQGKNDGNHDGYEQGFNDGKKGTAIANDVLQTKTFTNQTSVGINGTMKNYSNLRETVVIGEVYTIPRGYHDGTGTVYGSFCNYKKGSSWEFNYIGSATTFEVPCDGDYEVFVYGAEGGTGDYDGNRGGNNYSPEKGAYRASVTTMKKGLKLNIVVGQKPRGGYASYGEGATNGRQYRSYQLESVSGYETGKCDEVHWKNSVFGTAKKYRGYPDGNYGGVEYTICDRKGYHSGGATAGGGGGSSYISYNGSKIISAKGGNGGSTYYKAIDGSGTANGGTGGGTSTLSDSGQVTWNTSVLNVSQSSVRSGNGYIKIVLKSAT